MRKLSSPQSRYTGRTLSAWISRRMFGADFVDFCLMFLGSGAIYGWGRLPPAGIAQVALSLVVSFCVPLVANAEKRFCEFKAPHFGHSGSVVTSLER